MDKVDKILTTLICSLFIIPLGAGIALKKWAGPWTGEWSLPTFLIFWGFGGWIVIMSVLGLTFKKQYNVQSSLGLNESKFGIYGGTFIGAVVGFLLGSIIRRDPVNSLLGGSIMGAFWGLSLTQIGRDGGLSGIIISTITALITWTFICLKFNTTGDSSCLAFGIAGIMGIGFIGGIIGPVIYFIRHSDIKIKWL